jgi:hypothetical protein
MGREKFALLDRLQFFAEFSHSLGGLQSFVASAATARLRLRAVDPCGAASIASSWTSRRWFVREGRTFRFHGSSRALWIPVLASAMIFARRMLPMMSFSIFKARL